MAPGVVLKHQAVVSDCQWDSGSSYNKVQNMKINPITTPTYSLLVLFASYVGQNRQKVFFYLSLHETLSNSQAICSFEVGLLSKDVREEVISGRAKDKRKVGGRRG